MKNGDGVHNDSDDDDNCLCIDNHDGQVQEHGGPGRKARKDCWLGTCQASQVLIMIIMIMRMMTGLIMTVIMMTNIAMRVVMLSVCIYDDNVFCYDYNGWIMVACYDDNGYDKQHFFREAEKSGFTSEDVQVQVQHYKSLGNSFCDFTST